MNTKTLSIGLCVVIASLGACSVLPPAEQVMTSEARHSYVLAGTRSPTVILESGLGDGKDSWAPIFNQVAEVSQVFAYDRAGYGASRSAEGRRDGVVIARELHTTLQALNLRPPYVLVGHSIGGTYLELYARTYPEDVAGVVLVDSRHADFTRQCLLAGARLCEPPALLSALLPDGPKQELASGKRIMEEVKEAGAFPNIPLVVLTSGKQFHIDDRFYLTWLATQESLSALSSNSTHIICKRCGHYVHKDNPQLVVDAIVSVIEQARLKN